MKVGRKCSATSAMIAAMFIGIFMFAGYFALHNRADDSTIDSVDKKPPFYSSVREESWKSIFDDVIHPDKYDCDALLKEPERDENFYSGPYLEHRRQFRTELRQVAGPEYVQGNSADFRGQYRLFYWLARRPWVSTICEIGFNAGHSTLQWLASNDTTTVYSFDVGIHGYTRPMAEYLQQIFPGRLHLIIGDSRQTVPRFSATNRHVKCDLMIIDGGHSYEVAFSDLENMRSLANKHHNIVIFDDYLSTKGDVSNIRELGVPWNKMRADKFLVERYGCTLRKDKRRGFVVGYYL